MLQYDHYMQALAIVLTYYIFFRNRQPRILDTESLM